MENFIFQVLCNGEIYTFECDLKRYPDMGYEFAIDEVLKLLCNNTCHVPKWQLMIDHKINCLYVHNLIREAKLTYSFSGAFIVNDGKKIEVNNF